MLRERGNSKTDDEQELSELELSRQQRVEIREYLRQQTAMKV
jgi:hypothetical protein